MVVILTPVVLMVVGIPGIWEFLSSPPRACGPSRASLMDRVFFGLEIWR